MLQKNVLRKKHGKTTAYLKFIVIKNNLPLMFIVYYHKKPVVMFKPN